MHDSPGDASSRRSLLTPKVMGISLIVSVIGLLTLLLEFFPCQSVDFLMQWNLTEWGLFGIQYLFFISLFLWSIWWSIYSDNLDSFPKIYSVLGISLFWSAALFSPWGIALSITGMVSPKTSTFLRSAIALLGLNFNFWKRIKTRELKAAIVPWGISSMICLAIFFSETPYIKPINFNSRLADFEAVVALVDSGKLTPNVRGFVTLPCRYSHLGNSGNKFNKGHILIIKEGEAKIIRFRQRNYLWIKGTDDFIYRSDNKDISSHYTPSGNRIVKVEDHWFWQTSRW
jgi:hypothetical protein